MKKDTEAENTEMNRSDTETETNFSTLDSSLGLHGCQMVGIKTLYTQVPLEIICKANCDLEERYIQSSRPAKFSLLILL